MAFDKTVPLTISEYKIFDVDSGDELRKVASDDVSFPDGFEYDPDFLYLWIRIVSAGEYYGPNKNGDFFPEEELVEWFETFNDAHPFKNHENKKIENAIGTIISVRWNPVMKCVELLKGLDRKRAPEVTRGYEKGYLTDVSMGCKVPYTVCSVCGNKAKKRSEFCSHVNRHRNQMLDTGERVYEINYKPKFHDSSTVLSGAERVAKAFFIVDKQPADVASKPSFKKVASTDGRTHFYIPYTDDELEKIATYEESVHPLLKEYDIEKVASNPSPLMKKIAEIQKELTGKVLNIASIPDQGDFEKSEQMLEAIKFLTEKRFDEDSLKNMAYSIESAAKQHGVDTKKAFCTFLGVAELMGIEFFPNELHTMLSEVTNTKLNDHATVSEIDDSADEVLPGEYLRTMDDIAPTYYRLSDGGGLSDMVDLFDNAPLDEEAFLSHPSSYLQSLKNGFQDEMDYEPPVTMIRIFKDNLDPVVKYRSQSPEHLMPRLSFVADGRLPIVGGEEVRRDLDMLARPQTMGDMLSSIAYSLYESNRPNMMRSRMVKIAEPELKGFEKVAAIKKRHIVAGAVPLAYGASAFQNSRRDHGRYLSDAENFVADKPGWTAAGGIAAGVGALAAGRKGGAVLKANSGKALAAGKKGVNAVKSQGAKASNALKRPFQKTSSTDFDGIFKEASSFESGDYNLFNDDDLTTKVASLFDVDLEQVEAIKLALVLDEGGFEKAAEEVRDHYEIPKLASSEFLKIATDHMDGQLEKAANEFLGNLSLSMVADRSPMGQTLPGRAVDAMVFKKLMNLGKDENIDTDVPEPEVETNA